MYMPAGIAIYGKLFIFLQLLGKAKVRDSDYTRLNKIW